MRWALAIFALLSLAACGSANVPSIEQVKNTLIGVGAHNVHVEPFANDAPVPRSFTSRQVFVLDSVAPKGGQVFICDTKKNCDAIYAYFDALKGLGGPYYYQSPSGLVVLQLNSGLAPNEAEKIAQSIKGL